MPELLVSAPFRNFLEDYARRIGKSASVIVEEAVSQAIHRHAAAGSPSPDDVRIVMPPAVQETVRGWFPDLDLSTETDARFGEFFEHLPDRTWTYLLCRYEDWWFLVVAKDEVAVPDAVELKYAGRNQGYCWTYGYGKAAKLWSGPDLFLIVF